MSENAQKPRIRFKGFSDAWEQRKLSEHFTKYQNTVYLDDNEKYVQISVRNTGTVEYRDTKKGCDIGRKRQYMIDTKTYPLTLTFTRQTVYEGGIGFVPESLNGAIVTENMPLLAMNDADKDFIVAFVKTTHYYSRVIDDNTLIGSAQKALHEKLWLNSEVLLPKYSEQGKIGALFRNLESLITLHQRKYDKLVAVKKALLEKMFPADGETVPKIRFKGFSDAWEQRKLGDLFNYYRPDNYIVKSDKYVENAPTPVLTANKGFILGYTSENRTFSQPCIIFDDFTLDNKFVDFPFMVKSSAMKILVLKDEKFDDLIFCYELLNSTKIEVLGHARHYISVVQPTVVNIPRYEEQRRISELFQQISNLITLHQRQLEKLKNIKSALLEKMFV